MAVSAMGHPDLEHGRYDKSLAEASTYKNGLAHFRFKRAVPEGRHKTPLWYTNPTTARGMGGARELASVTR